MRNRKENKLLQYPTNQELLERMIKLEKLVQELEQKIKEVSDSCSCIKEDLEEKEEFIESESYTQTLIEPITKQIMPELRCNCGGSNYNLYGCNLHS